MAAELLTVGGSPSDVLNVDKDNAVVMGFRLDRAATNVAVSFNLYCLRCKAIVSLNKGKVGPDSGFSDTVKTVALTSSSVNKAVIQVPKLDSGSYFVIVYLEEGRAGLVNSGKSRTSSGNGARRIFDLVTSDTVSYPPKSSFRADPKLGLNFVVSGN